MLTLKDCLDFCELTEDEIHAIAEHEQVPEIVAAELGSSLLQSGSGVQAIQRFIQDNIRNAESNGQAEKAKRLEKLLARFRAAHPCSDEVTSDKR
jgi:hypothetical protein